VLHAQRKNPQLPDNQIAKIPDTSNGMHFSTGRLWKIPHLRWWIAGLVFVSTVINYIDRQTLSILAPRITHELHMSEQQYGFIVQAFLVAYTIMYLVSGIIIDRWGVKWTLAIATAWWSVAEMLHGLVHSPFSLGICRMLLGTGESANFIAVGKISAEWYPPKDRGTMNGLVQAAAVVGAVLAAPVALWLMFRWSWRVAFIATGGIGFLWVAVWWWMYDTPEESSHLTENERRLIVSSQKTATSIAGKTERVRYWDLLRMPTTMGLLVARIFSDPAWWFYLFWLPKYLTEGRSLTMKQMGYVVWIPYLASDIGSIIGGWASGKLIQRGWDVLKARRFLMLISALLMPLGVFAGFVVSPWVAVGIISVVLMAHMSWKTNLATLSVDLYPRPVIGRVAGIVATGSGIGGALFISIAGSVIARWSYRPLFFVMGFLHLIGFAIVLWLVREPQHETPALEIKPA
jgi:ACS family hexuronate transporter-like MFS transporter